MDAESRFLALADSLPLGVAVIDDGRIDRVNAVVERQLRCTRDALAGRDFTTLFEQPALARALMTREPPFDVEAYLRRDDGEIFRAEVGVRLLGPTRRLLVVCDKSESDHAQALQREQLHAMTRRLMSVQEDERRTLSRELHDDIGQQITAIKLGALALQSETDPGRRDETISEIIAITDQTVAKIRNLSLLLRPPQLDALGLEAALRWQTDVMFRSGAPRVELSLTALPQRPPQDVELAAFRIAQESLTNVLRHAQATEVRLSLEQRDGWLLLTVYDDGCGFERNFRAGGLGLATMRERAEQLGGRVDIESGADRGTTVRAQLPLASSD